MPIDRCRRRGLLFGIVLLVEAVCCAAAAAGEPAALPAPIRTNSAEFQLPFKAAGLADAANPTLFASADRGQTWVPIATASRASDRFAVSVPSDGEYWLIPGERDQSPAGDAVPEMRVVVDRESPVVQLSAVPVAGRPPRVNIRWSCRDADARGETVIVAVAEPGDETWQIQNIRAAAAGSLAYRRRNPASADRPLVVRVTIRDQAGNIGEARRTVDVRPARQQTPSASRMQIVAAPSRAVAGGRPVRQVAASPNDLAIDELSLPVVEDTPPLLTVSESQPLAVASQQTPPTGLRIQPGEKSVTRPPVVGGARRRTPTWPTPETNVPSESSPVGAGLRLVGARQFRIGYELEQVGPSGVGEVEFFITEDGGKVWYKYGTDEDRKSPFAVRVPKDGVYGFSMRVRSGVGLTTPVPQPGEPPDSVVVVDTTPPEAKITSAKPPALNRPRQARGTDRRLLIEWTVSDNRPLERPVFLAYASDPSGPWEPIAGWLPNTGRHTWQVPEGAPGQVYLQLIARDEAGNTTRHQPARPVLLDLSRPKARILGVTPAR